MNLLVPYIRFLRFLTPHSFFTPFDLGPMHLPRLKTRKCSTTIGDESQQTRIRTASRVHAHPSAQRMRELV